MESKKGDEHPHRPICEVCHREFDDVHELSKHVNKIEQHDSEDYEGI
jgi:hypothetical protein